MSLADLVQISSKKTPSKAAAGDVGVGPIPKPCFLDVEALDPNWPLDWSDLFFFVHHQLRM